MLKLNPKPTFDADVKITVPGQSEAGTMKLTFRYLPKAESRALMKRLVEEKDENGDVVQKAITEDELVSEIVVGWKGIDADFNAENLLTFLNNYPAAAWDIINAYSHLVHESRVKN